MKRLKSIGIRNLKDKLSAVIQEASSGVTYLITDRGEVVAQISKPSLIDLSTAEGKVFSNWLENNSVAIPKRKTIYKSPKFQLSGYSSGEILDELRDEK